MILENVKRSYTEIYVGGVILSQSLIPLTFIRLSRAGPWPLGKRPMITGK